MTDADLLIVGSGIMGAAVAALVREAHPDARILMVDGGPAITARTGEHLHDVDDPDVWDRYNQRVTSGIQGLYAGDETFQPAKDALEDLDPGMHRLSALGEDADELPGAALAWNVGGMGVHWTAATPDPAAHERFGDPARWDADLAVARRLLQVSPSPLGPTNAGELVLDALRAAVGDVDAARAPQPMPMAAQEVDGRLRRTSPAVIFPPIATGDDPHFTLLPSTLAVALLRQDARVTGARVRDVESGAEHAITAAVTVVCADALRTPQLLHASGIRPPALGRYLNEHAFVSNRVMLDLERFGLALDALPPIRDGEFVTDSLWIPTTGADQPFHAQVMNRTYVDDDRHPLAYGVGVSVYVPTEVRAENRIEFTDEADLTGMPRMRARFAHSAADEAQISRALAWMSTLASALGDWDPVTDSKLLAAGSSLHFTGTVRAGDADDGTSVCDHAGRVWGVDDLFVAGNGVIPTALACNSTLTGVVTAVRAAEAVVARLTAERIAA